MNSKPEKFRTMKNMERVTQHSDVTASLGTITIRVSAFHDAIFFLFNSDLGIFHILDFLTQGNFYVAIGKVDKRFMKTP